MSLLKKIIWNLLWGIALGLGYSLIIIFIMKSYAKVRLDEWGYTFGALNIVELILLGFFTGLIASFASRPFKISKIISCILIGTIGFLICPPFFSQQLLLDSWHPFYVLALFMSIVIGIIDRSLIKPALSLIYFVTVFIVGWPPLPQIADSSIAYCYIFSNSLLAGILIVFGVGIGELIGKK